MAATHGRTPAQRNHHGGQWAKILEKMDRMREWAKTATPEQKHAASTLAGRSGPGLGYEDVKRLAEKPMESMLAVQGEVATPRFAGVGFAVLRGKAWGGC